MIDEKKLIEEVKKYHSNLGIRYITKLVDAEIQDIIGIINEQPKVGEWIPCSERFPTVETEVLIVAKRKFRGGGFRYIITSAMYEDGTIRENDSCWRWENIEGEWDEEEDCYIIPEGWWENRHYNTDDVYNNAVDDEVIAWMPLPEPYIGK